MVYKFRQAETYVYLNYNLIEAFILEAKAEVKVKVKKNETTIWWSKLQNQHELLIENYEYT